jgi:hypothetical protein
VLTASSGWKRTLPSSSPQTKSTGRPRRSSHLAALLRIPLSSRVARRVQLRFAHRSLRPEQQAIIERRGMIEAVSIGDQRVGETGAVDESIHSALLGARRETSRSNRSMGGDQRAPAVGQARQH